MYELVQTSRICDGHQHHVVLSTVEPFGHSAQQFLNRHLAVCPHTHIWAYGHVHTTQYWGETHTQTPSAASISHQFTLKCHKTRFLHSVIQQLCRQSDRYESVGEKYEGIFYEHTFLPVPLSSSHRVPALLQTQLVEESFILKDSKHVALRILLFRRYTEADTHTLRQWWKPYAV